jgi:archaemetzincin
MKRRSLVALAGVALLAGGLGTTLWIAGLSANDPIPEFVPPSPAERLKAIGPLRGVSPINRRALDPGESFLPIPKPGPSDWLATQKEEGQTFEEFLASRPNRPDAKQSKIYLQPLGEFDPLISPDLNDLKAIAQAYFQMEISLLPGVPLAAGQLTNRKHPQTRQTQFLTGDILQMLRQQLPPDAYCLLGITMQDLYPEDSWNFVFGQASLRNRVGVYSFARYDPGFQGRERQDSDKELILKRSCGVLVHETGHMFGIKHCIHFQCVMNGSNHLEESDSRDLYLCPVCLRKLGWSTAFDVVKRYRELQSLYQKHGLKEDAKWVKDRLEWIEGAE